MNPDAVKQLPDGYVVSAGEGVREFYRQQGAIAERERIIKLLEVLWQKTQGTDLPAVVVLPDAIALIKGEQE